MDWEFTSELYTTAKKNKLQKVHELVKQLFQDSDIHSMWCIAGGAVRDQLRGIEYAIKDYDIFISQPMTPAQLAKLGTYGELKQSTKSYPGFLVFNFRHKDVAEPIQFIYNSNEPSQAYDLDGFIRDTLNTFDWSVNCVAYRNSSIYSLQPVDAPKDVLYLRYCKVNPVGAIYRGMKLKTNFGMFIDSNAWLTLAKAITALNDDIPF